MRKVCEICDTPYHYNVKDPVSVSLVPNICSKPCFTTLLKEGIINSLPLYDTIIEQTYFRRLSENMDPLRNKFEGYIRLYLGDLGFDVCYEPFLFTTKTIGYLPDFMVTLPMYTGQVFIEAKGLWTAGAHKKVISFRNWLGAYESNIWVIDAETFRRIHGKS